MKKKIDTSLVDKAITFAVNAHKGIERKGKGFPYVIHPLEAVAIVATITPDPELLAAAALHDVVEDTEYTEDDIRREFGDRVAELVKAESDVVVEGVPEEESWHFRKQAAMDRLRDASMDAKIVAIGDKLSNLRAISRDYDIEGEAFWSKFHVKEREDHEWHYRGLADSLIALKDTEPYKEFLYLLEKVFANGRKEFSYKVNGERIWIAGILEAKNMEEIFSLTEYGKNYVLDFDGVRSINFAAMRRIVRAYNEGYSFIIVNASQKVFDFFASTGVISFISISKAPKHVSMTQWEESGEGYTAVSYFNKSGDSMMKLYHDFINTETVEREKRIAQSVFKLGIPTPLSGDIVKEGKRLGVSFERIENKKSFARAYSENPEKIGGLAMLFSSMSKRLHETTCDVNVFSSAKELNIALVDRATFLSDLEKDKIKKFIKSVKTKKTCLHGDFHFGNAIITDDGDKMFIDVADFSYGHPYFDLGTFYLIAMKTGEELTQKLYHCSEEMLIKFWKRFASYYFGVEEKDLPKIEEELKPFAGLKAIFFSNQSGDNTGKFRKVINEWLLDRI